MIDIYNAASVFFVSMANFWLGFFMCKLSSAKRNSSIEKASELLIAKNDQMLSVSVWDGDKERCEILDKALASEVRRLLNNG